VDVTAEQVRALADLHEQSLRRYPAAAELDVSFVPIRFLGTYGDATLPYFRDGRFSPGGGGDVNPVMWHTLRTRGIALWGPPAAEVVPPVRWEELAENMHRNLGFLARRMPRYLAGGTRGQVFGVLTLCRVLYTLRTREVGSKMAAARWALCHVDSRWRPLIERAMARYRDHDLTGTDPLLEQQAEAFAAYIHEIAEPQDGP
jgi:hypothetical protein